MPLPRTAARPPFVFFFSEKLAVEEPGFAAVCPLNCWTVLAMQLVL